MINASKGWMAIPSSLLTEEEIKDLNCRIDRMVEESGKDLYCITVSSDDKDLYAEVNKAYVDYHNRLEARRRYRRS